jgi:FKBP-type peptidyl-prolyl cis-trans isomerase SlyD
VGAIVPMNTVDGQIINAQIAEITKDHVTIDLNHPLAGENLHFVGKVLNIREVTEGELKALHHRGCGGCKGSCGDCNSDCGGNCEGNCEGGCH